MDIFLEIGLLIILASIGAYIAKLTKQPLIPAYIVAGVLLGPILGMINNTDLIHNLSEIGIAFLLFIVGLELELKKIKNIGAVSAVVGTLQVSLMFAAGFALMHFIGLRLYDSIYLGIVIAFSSTMIVVKLLSDKRELATLHGRLIIGILVMQDILAIIAISVMASTNALNIIQLLFFVGKGVLIIMLAFLLSRYVFPPVFEFAAKSQELLLVISLSVCFLFSMIFSFLGFSIAIGAFIAGIALANLPYNVEIIGRVRSLRDFFAILFFTSLGMQLKFSSAGNAWLPILLLSVLVILLKPIITYAILHISKYTTKTSFLTSINLAQISEFSLIIVAQGLALGHISDNILFVTIMLAIITITSTSYFVKYEDSVYAGFRRLIKLVRIKERKHHSDNSHKAVYDVVLCGYDRIGYSILKTLYEAKKEVLIVDYNPEVIKSLRSKNVPCLYGDITDPEVIERINLKESKMFVSTANKFEDNLLILQKVKDTNNYIPCIVTAQKIDEALELYKKGADYVILPHFLGGDMVANILGDFEKDQLKMMVYKYQHVNDLMSRKDHGHEHPLHVRA